MLKCKRFIALALVLALSCFSGTSIFADDDLPAYQPGDFVCFNAITGEVSIVNANDYPALSTSAPSNMAPTFQPFNIFGSDDRTVVDDMSVSPYNSIAYLRIRNFYGIAGCRGTATAFAPNAFITSAHMFFDNSTKPKTLVINPTYRPIDLIFNYDGLNSNPPESAMTSYNYNDIDDDFDIEFVFIPASYLSEPTIENFASDYAIVKTTESIFSSYLGFSQNASVDETVTLCGFPEQTSNTSANTVDRRPYESTGEIIQVGTDAFYYLIDASAGQSGAPVFNSSNQILGVHSGGNISSNRACKVDAPLYSMMLAIRNNDL